MCILAQGGTQTGWMLGQVRYVFGPYFAYEKSFPVWKGAQVTIPKKVFFLNDFRMISGVKGSGHCSRVVLSCISCAFCIFFGA